MIRIMMSCRERPAYTEKCIEALEKYTESEYELFLFDDRSENKKTHELYIRLAEETREKDPRHNRIDLLGIIPPKSQVNHGTFGKAWWWVIFAYMSTYGHGNRFDDSRRRFDFMVLMDNDIFVKREGWDRFLMMGWDLINYRTKVGDDRFKNIKILTQAPGGIMSPRGPGQKKFDLFVPESGRYFGQKKEIKIRIGPCGGSGFWMIKPTYFNEVGTLPLESILGQNKKHDQLSWAIHQQTTKSLMYAGGLWTQTIGPKEDNGVLALHVGHEHSICNYLTYGHNQIRKRIDREERNFKDMTVEEIIEKYDRKEYQRW